MDHIDTLLNTKPDSISTRMTDLQMDRKIEEEATVFWKDRRRAPEEDV